MTQTLFHSPVTFFLFQTLSELLRYLILGGLAFWGIWILGARKFAPFKIQAQGYSTKLIRREIVRSLGTLVVFSAVGAVAFELQRTYGGFRFYSAKEHGALYAAWSFVALLFIHDTYFYWTHRLLHTPFFYRFHLAHHESVVTTPFTIFSFSPTEALIQAVIIPLAALIMPIHVYVALGFAVFSTLMNSIAHLGYEFYNERFRNSLLFEVWTSSTHHNLHHRHFRSNYGFYMRIWDRICKTEHPGYEAIFTEKVANSKKDLAFSG